MPTIPKLNIESQIAVEDYAWIESPRGATLVVQLEATPRTARAVQLHSQLSARSHRRSTEDIANKSDHKQEAAREYRECYAAARGHAAALKHERAAVKRQAAVVGPMLKSDAIEAESLRKQEQASANRRAAKALEARKRDQVRRRAAATRKRQSDALSTFGEVKLQDETLRSFLAHVKANNENEIRALAVDGELARLCNDQNHSGDTALMLAAWHGHESIAALLLDNGADVSLCNCEGNTALCCAASRGHSEVTRLLLDAKAPTEATDYITGKTPLHKAAYFGHTAVARELLVDGADANAADSNGYTALAFAASMGHADLGRLLLDFRANPNAADIFGVTPLIHAAARGDEAVLRRLLEEAATSVDLADLEGRSAISYAHANGHARLVAILEEVGVSDLVSFGLGRAEAEAAIDIKSALRDVGRHAVADMVTPRQLATPRCSSVRAMPRVPIAKRPSPKKRPPLPPLQTTGCSTVAEDEEVTPPPSAERMRTVDATSVNYLSKKLCNLCTLLLDQEDLRPNDDQYPSAARRLTVC